MEEKKEFDAHQFIQWCITHPTDKAPVHTVGDLLKMQAHVEECPDCDAACRKAQEMAPARPPFSDN